MAHVNVPEFDLPSEAEIDRELADASRVLEPFPEQLEKYRELVLAEEREDDPPPMHPDTESHCAGRAMLHVSLLKRAWGLDNAERDQRDDDDDDDDDDGDDDDGDDGDQRLPALTEENVHRSGYFPETYDIECLAKDVAGGDVSGVIDGTCFRWLSLTAAGSPDEKLPASVLPRFLRALTDLETLSIDTSRVFGVTDLRLNAAFHTHPQDLGTLLDLLAAQPELLPALRKLGLEDNNLKAPQVCAVAKFLQEKDSRIEQLNLRYNRGLAKEKHALIVLAGALSTDSNSSLHSLDLRMCADLSYGGPSCVGGKVMHAFMRAICSASALQIVQGLMSNAKWGTDEPADAKFFQILDRDYEPQGYYGLGGAGSGQCRLAPPVAGLLALSAAEGAGLLGGGGRGPSRAGLLGGGGRGPSRAGLLGGGGRGPSRAGLLGGGGPSPAIGGGPSRLVRAPSRDLDDYGDHPGFLPVGQSIQEDVPILGQAQAVPAKPDLVTPRERAQKKTAYWPCLLAAVRAGRITRLESPGSPGLWGLVLAGVVSRASSLRVLDLSGYGLNQVYTVAIAKALMNEDCGLEVLNLSGNYVRRPGCAALGKALGTAHSRLQELRLAGSTELGNFSNQPETDGVLSFIEPMRTNCVLEILDCTGCESNSHSASFDAILGAVAGNPNSRLQELGTLKFYGLDRRINDVLGPIRERARQPLVKRVQPAPAAVSSIAAVSVSTAASVASPQSNHDEGSPLAD